MAVRLPGLLAADLTETARLHPTAGTVTLKMTGSGEATLTLPEDSPAVNIHDWVSVYTQNGRAGIFRVSNVAQNYKHQIDITLLHGIDILADSVWAAQTDFSGTKQEFLTALLNQQTHLVNGVKPWVLGTCAATGTYEKSINYDRLSNLLEEMVQEGGGYYFTYDQSTWPWTLNFVAAPSGVDSEFRLTRNVRGATITYNDADLCTRLHLTVSSKRDVTDSETQETETVYGSAVKTYDNAAAQAVWGVVVKTADIDTHDDIEEQHFDSADAWAANFLAQRADPSVQIEVDGDELALLTGDSWDELSIGKLCRVALPDYGHSFEERVVSVSYPDLFRDPSHVTVSLANTLPRFSESIAQAREVASVAARSARASARSIEKDEKEITHWSQKVQYHDLALDGTGVLTLYESGIDMDATGGVTIYSLQEGLQALYSSIQVNAQGITLQGETITSIGSTVQSLSGTVTTIDGKVSTIEGSALWQNKSNVVAVTGAMEYDATNNKLVVKNGNGLYVTRDNTQLGVWDSGNLTAGIIVSKINGSSDQTETTILSSKIKLNGDTTLAGKLSVNDSGLTTISGSVGIGNISSGIVSINGGKVTAANIDLNIGGELTFVTGQSSYVKLTGAVLTGMVTDVQISGPVNNVYTLQKKTVGNSSWQNCNVTFSRAATLSGGWGSGSSAGIFSVDASPQDQHYKIKFNGTSGTADATLDAVVSASGVTPILNGTYLQFTLNIGTYTEGADMVTRAALTRSVPCSSVTGLAATNPLTVASQTDAQWADLSGVTEITSQITSGGKYLITASPKYGAPAQLRFIAPSGGGSDDRTVTSLTPNPITLTSSQTGTSSHTLTAHYSTGSDSTVSISVDAAAVYLAGQAAAQAGNVDVVKGPWTDSATGKECEFYPASGNGTHQYVNITSTARVPAGSGFDLIGTAGLYTIKDTYGNSTLATPLFHLSIDGNYVYATTDNNTPTVGTNAMARIDIASSRSINYVVSSGGMISVYSQNGQTLVGYLYPNTDVSVSSGDSVRYIVQYNNRSGYVYKSSVSSQKGPTDYPGHIGWSDEVSGRTVSLIDTVVLASTDTGISTHNNIGITYSDGSNGTCTVTVNASAISGGTQRSVSSLSQVSLSSNHTSSTAYPVTVTYDDGTTGASTITVSTANYVQTNKTITYTANGTYTLSPTSPYGAMSSASITVNVPGGTSQQRTAIGLADTIVLPASHTGTATISGNYVEYDDDTETGNFPVRINASAVYQAGVAYGQDTSGYHLATVTLQGRETKFKGQYLYKKLQTTVNDRGSSAGTAYVPDNNGSYKLQGTQVGRSYYGTLYQLDDYDRPVSVGSGSWFLVSGSVGALFKGDGTSLKTESLYYGNGGSYNVCGDYQYCYVIDADGTVSYYSAGQTVSDTYYIRST